MLVAGQSAELVIDDTTGHQDDNHRIGSVQRLVQFIAPPHAAAGRRILGGKLDHPPHRFGARDIKVIEINLPVFEQAGLGQNRTRDA